MKLKRLKISWLRTIGGLLFFAIGFSRIILTEKINPNELISINLFLKEVPDKKSRIHKEYEIYCSNYSNTFVVDRTACVASHWSGIKDLQVGDSIKIKIHSTSKDDLNEIDKEILIYELIRNDKMIYSVDEYNNAEKQQDIRWGTIGMLIGGLVTLRGTKLISSSTGYKIGLTSLVSIIIMTYFDIW